MNVSTPKDMGNYRSVSIDKVINDFESLLRREIKGKDQYSLIIIGELPRESSDKVEDAYREAGWLHVLCRTSSESGDRPGLTRLHLSMKPLT